jgi:hypothetical protein
VWGVCTFKHVCSRNPKHPKLAMAHNWVVMGDLTPPDRPGAWTYLPTAPVCTCVSGNCRVANALPPSWSRPPRC